MNASDPVLPTVTGSTLRPGAKVRLDGHGHAWIAPPSLAPEVVPALTDERTLVEGLALFGRAAKPSRAAMLDCQAPGSGRDAAALARIASKSNVAIAALTGFQFSRAYPKGLRPWTTIDGALAAFTRELEGGFREAPMARAAALLAAFAGEPEEGDPCWEAVIESCKRTGSLLVVRTEGGDGVEDLVTWLRSRDVPLERLYLLDVDRRDDVGLHRELAQAGALLGFASSLRPDAGNASEPFTLLERLLEEGLARSVAVGLGLQSPEQWRAAGPSAKAVGPATLVTVVEERLRGHGATDEDVEALLGGTLLERAARPEVSFAARHR